MNESACDSPLISAAATSAAVLLNQPVSMSDASADPNADWYAPAASGMDAPVEAEASSSADAATTTHSQPALPTIDRILGVRRQFAVPPSEAYVRAMSDARSGRSRAALVDHYFKGVKYSPDGLCLLSCVESGGGGAGLVGQRQQQQRQRGRAPKRRRVNGAPAAAAAGSSSIAERAESALSSSSSENSDASSDSSSDSSSSSDDDDSDAASTLLDASDRRGLSMFELPPLRWNQAAAVAQQQPAPSYEYDVAGPNHAAAAATVADSPASAAPAAAPGAAPHLRPTLRAWPGDSVYDFCWNSVMDSRSPHSSWFLSSARSNPVHMWDAYSGQIRASYSAYDHVDELTAALSLAVTPATAVAAGAPQRIYAGFDKCIRVFEVERPGRECVTIPTVRKASSGGGGQRTRLRLSHSQSSRSSGQSGIISCMDVSSAHPSLLAAGSYNGSVGLYNLDAAPASALEHKIFIDSRGVSQVRFSIDGVYLFVGTRRAPDISVFDMRNVVAPVALLRRANDTNLRLSFDVDSACSSRFLAAGDSLGHVLLWDLSVAPDAESSVIPPALRHKVADEALCGVSMHPHFSSTVPIIATCSGQRHFFLANGNDAHDGSDSELETGGNSGDDQPQAMQMDDTTNGAALAAAAAPPPPLASDSHCPAVNVSVPSVAGSVLEYTSASAPCREASAAAVTHSLAVWCVDHTIMQPPPADPANLDAAVAAEPAAQ